MIDSRQRVPMTVVAAALLCSLAVAGAQSEEPIDPQSRAAMRKPTAALQASATRSVEPFYPPDAWEAQVTGPVIVEVQIEEGGSVISARALTGHHMLREAAVEAARHWTFIPSRRNGKPVQVAGRLRFNFSINGRSTADREVRRYEREVSNQPQSVASHHLLGEAYRELGQYREAKRALKRAVEIDPSFAAAYYSLGMACLFGTDNEDLQEAQDAFKRAIELNPQSAAAYHGLGLAYSGSSTEKAIAAFERAVALKPDRAESHYHLGTSYAARGRLQQALEALKNAVSQKPQWPEARLALGLAFAKAGDKAAALNEHESLGRSYPGMAAYLMRRIDEIMAAKTKPAF